MGTRVAAKIVPSRLHLRETAGELRDTFWRPLSQRRNVTDPLEGTSACGGSLLTSRNFSTRSQDPEKLRETPVEIPDICIIRLA